MKTAISLPDDVYKEAEQLAQRLGKSRSQLYVEALRQYLAAHDDDAITRSVNEVADELNADSEWTLAAAASVLRRVEWQ